MLIFFVLVLLSLTYVEAAAVSASFSTSNTAPADPSAIQLQDGFTNDLQCSGGASWDNFASDKNMTTHMLNATLRWDKGVENNSDSVYTFVCIASTRARIDAIGLKNETTNNNCNILNAWNDVNATADNTTGVILNVNFTIGRGVGYNTSHSDYFGALMSWDGTQGANNRSAIVLFNFTIENRPPTVPSALNTTTTHDTTPNLAWTQSQDPEDGSGADKCPADNVTYTLSMGSIQSGDIDHLNVNTTTQSYGWVATALSFNNTVIASSKTNQTEYYRLFASDGRGQVSVTNYSGSLYLENNLPTAPSALIVNETPNKRTSHSPGMEVNWTASTDADGGDIITYNISISLINYTMFEFISKNFTTTATGSIRFFEKTLPWGNIIDAAINSTNKTAYIRMFPIDNNQPNIGIVNDYNITVQLVNYLPTTPTTINSTFFHSQYPNVGWGTATDSDGDPVTYLFKIGDVAYGDTNYLNSSSAVAKATGSVAIPWEGLGQGTGWNNHTVYLSLAAKDDFNANMTAGYTNKSIQLVDYIPDVEQLLLTDTTTAYGNCTGSGCTLNPVSGSNISLAAFIYVYDQDADCPSMNRPKLYLCLNSTTVTGCGDNVNANFSWIVETSDETGTECLFRFGTNLTTVNNTPGFFIAPGPYKFQVNVTSFANNVRNDTQDLQRNGTWTFGTLSSVDYTSAVVVGGSDIVLGSWSSGVNLYTMTNYGNNILDLRWNTTYFGRAGAAMNWTPDGSDFQIDDDNLQADESAGKIPPIFLTADDSYFNYTTGLQRCVNKYCSSAVENETLDTYYHIKPPVGLSSGTYSSTLTYIAKTHKV
jgi:hypothetical protein